MSYNVGHCRTLLVRGREDLLLFRKRTRIEKRGGEQSPFFLGHWGANGPNDLKFCIQGAFVGYY